MHLYVGNVTRLPDRYRAEHTTAFVNQHVVAKRGSAKSGGRQGAPKSKASSAAAFKIETVNVLSGTKNQRGMNGVTGGSAAISTQLMHSFIAAMAADIAVQSYPQIGFCASGVDYRSRLVFDFDFKSHHSSVFPDKAFIALAMFITHIVSEFMSNHEEVPDIPITDITRDVSSITAIRKSVCANTVTYGDPSDEKVGMHLAFDIICSVTDGLMIRRHILTSLATEFSLQQTQLKLFLLDPDKSGHKSCMKSGSIHTYGDLDQATVEDMASNCKALLHEIFTTNPSLARRDLIDNIINVDLESFLDSKPIIGRMLRAPWNLKGADNKDKCDTELNMNIYVPMIAYQVNMWTPQHVVYLEPVRPTEIYARALLPLLIPNLCFRVDVSCVDPYPIFVRYPSLCESAKTDECTSIKNAIAHDCANYVGSIRHYNTDIPSARADPHELYLGQGERVTLASIRNYSITRAAENVLLFNSGIDEDIVTKIAGYLKKKLSDISEPVDNPCVEIGTFLATNPSHDYSRSPAEFPFKRILGFLSNVQQVYPWKDTRGERPSVYAANGVNHITINQNMREMSLALSGHVYCHVKGGFHKQEGGFLIFFKDVRDKKWKVFFRCLCGHKGQAPNRPDCNPAWTGCGDHKWDTDRKNAEVLSHQVNDEFETIFSQIAVFKDCADMVNQGRIDELVVRFSQQFNRMSINENSDDTRLPDGTPINNVCSTQNFRFW